MNALLSRLEQNPIIAAVRHRGDIPAAANSPVEMVFLLCGELLNVREDIEKLHEAGKLVLVHMDLLGGIGRDSAAVDFLTEFAKPDGIISTRSQVIRRAKERNLLTIQRFFLLDSQSADMTAETAASSRPDMAEIMPGICPRVLQNLACRMKTPMIAGGMIEKKEDILAALKAGAKGVSTSRVSLWSL